MKVVIDGVFPEAGEWVMSPQPNDFVVCLTNDTGILPQYDRLAFCVRVGGQGELDADGKRDTELQMFNLYSVVGKQPGEQIPPTEENEGILGLVAGRIGEALDTWTTGSTEEEQEAFWDLSAAHMPSRIKEVLAKILSTAKGEQ